MNEIYNHVNLPSAVISIFFCWCFTAAYSQTTLIDPNGNGGFESGTTFAANNWTSVNGTQTNKWWVGSVATPASGVRCAYISNDAAGTVYDYETTLSTTHFYQDVAIPAGESDITLSFSWKGNGETNQDFLKVFICPTTVTVNAGTVIAATYQVGTTYNLQTAWQTTTITLSCTGYGGTTQRLVFSWKNNANAVAGQPPAAVDDISMVSSSASGAANDLPCNAVPLTLGVIQSGDNTCTGNSGEPTVPTCWAGADISTVWFSITCPASGEIRVNFFTGTLYYSQIALYFGTCNSLTYVNNSCVNHTTMQCPGKTYTGLVAGTTYYIRVDGHSVGTTPDEGTFNIVASDGTVTPPLTLFDCEGATDICSTTHIEPFGSFGCGTIEEIPLAPSISNPVSNPNCCNQGCLLTTPIAELHVKWYKIYINSAGSLKWTLTSGVIGFFDWELWDITSSSCSDIKNNLLPPVRCNWNGVESKKTGMESPVPAGGTPANFQQPLNVNAGETYVLAISNYSELTTGYTIDFANATCGIGNGTTATWSGNSSTAWITTNNWNGCGSPSCSIDAIINPATNQPVISVDVNAKNLTINAGATLTINAGVTLTICGNLTNNGTINASPSSTIVFTGTGAQTISGNLTGSNQLGNVTINKTGGSVTLNSNLDIGGSFTTSTNQSIFSINGMYLKVADDFTNFSGATTFTNTNSSSVEFNGAVAQTYKPGGALTLNNVIVNQSITSSVTLSGNNLTLGTSGYLTLTNGRIVTGAYEVNATNSNFSAVSTGNVNSYVDGNLRRSVSSTGSYDFPVGNFDSGKGYQRANINFTSATNVSNLLTRFDTYSAVPAGLGLTDCSIIYTLPALDNGYWTITATPAMTSGLYSATLFNTAGTYTNLGATGWTINKNDGSGWMLDGTCATSTINTVKRDGMSGFSDFGTGQGTTTLPVELLSFTGIAVGDVNRLQWVTSSEINNDYFTAERSADADSFSDLLTVDAIGNSTEHKSYEAFDHHPFQGVTFYRLKQTDIDGSATWSQIIMIERASTGVPLLNFYPNPTSDMISFDLYTPVAGQIKLEVINVLGELLETNQLEVAAGVSKLTTMLSHYPAGIYYLRVSGNVFGYTQVNKVIKY